MAESNATIITTARRELLCKAASGEAETVPAVTKVAFGSGGVDSDGVVIVPSADQQELHNEVGRYPIDGVTYPVSTTARYKVTIPAADLEGAAISAVALVDSEGTLCAIRNILPKGKDAGVALIFTFDDEF